MGNFQRANTIENVNSTIDFKIDDDDIELTVNADKKNDQPMVLQTIDPIMDPENDENKPKLTVPPVIPGMQKKTSLLKTSGDKDKKKKGGLKVGFSIEGDELIGTE